MKVCNCTGPRLFLIKTSSLHLPWRVLVSHYHLSQIGLFPCVCSQMYKLLYFPCVCCLPLPCLILIKEYTLRSPMFTDFCVHIGSSCVRKFDLVMMFHMVMLHFKNCCNPDLTQFVESLTKPEKIRNLCQGRQIKWPDTLPYILESNPHPFHSFRGLKNQMRIRFAVKSWIWEKYYTVCLVGKGRLKERCGLEP
jgi:hypothetical protein